MYIHDIYNSLWCAIINASSTQQFSRQQGLVDDVLRHVRSLPRKRGVYSGYLRRSDFPSKNGFLFNVVLARQRDCLGRVVRGSLVRRTGRFGGDSLRKDFDLAGEPSMHVIEFSRRFKPKNARFVDGREGIGLRFFLVWPNPCAKRLARALIREDGVHLALAVRFNRHVTLVTGSVVHGAHHSILERFESIDCVFTFWRCGYDAESLLAFDEPSARRRRFRAVDDIREICLRTVR
mmetsp:Transcript_6896/g.27746  ORF Transcript_6896/g.27746 Transcript_6896/m.27746 type:complete len:235 (-) Transcript_6896:780-1484(-)